MYTKQWFTCLALIAVIEETKTLRYKLKVPFQSHFLKKNHVCCNQEHREQVKWSSLLHVKPSASLGMVQGNVSYDLVFIKLPTIFHTIFHNTLFWKFREVWFQKLTYINDSSQIIYNDEFFLFCSYMSMFTYKYICRPVPCIPSWQF